MLFFVIFIFSLVFDLCICLFMLCINLFVCWVECPSMCVGLGDPTPMLWVWTPKGYTVTWPSQFLE